MGNWLDKAGLKDFYNRLKNVFLSKTTVLSNDDSVNFVNGNSKIEFKLPLSFDDCKQVITIDTSDERLPYITGLVEDNDSNKTSYWSISPESIVFGDETSEVFLTITTERLRYSNNNESKNIYFKDIVTVTEDRDVVTGIKNGIPYPSECILEVETINNGGEGYEVILPNASSTNAGVMVAADKTKLDAIQSYTIGEGLKVENGVLKCDFTPTKYYTGSTEPASTLGNNGDLYLLIK